MWRNSMGASPWFYNTKAFDNGMEGGGLGNGGNPGPSPRAGDHGGGGDNIDRGRTPRVPPPSPPPPAAPVASPTTAPSTIIDPTTGLPGRPGQGASPTAVADWQKQMIDLQKKLVNQTSLRSSPWNFSGFSNPAHSNVEKAFSPNPWENAIAY